MELLISFAQGAFWFGLGYIVIMLALSVHIAPASPFEALKLMMEGNSSVFGIGAKIVAYIITCLGIILIPLFLLSVLFLLLRGLLGF